MSDVVKVILKDIIANKLVALKLKPENQIGRAITVLKKKYDHLQSLDLALYFKNIELDVNMTVGQFVEDFGYTEKKRIEIREVIVEPAPTIQKDASEYIAMMHQGGENFSRAVLEILTEANMLSDNIDSIITKAKQLNKSVGQILIDGKYVDERDYLTTIANKLDIPSVDLSSIDISHNILSKIPQDVAECYSILPVYEQNGILYIATPNPFDVQKLNAVRSSIQAQIDTVLSTEATIKKKIKDLYKDYNEAQEAKKTVKKAALVIEDGMKVDADNISDEKCEAPTIWQDRNDDFFEDNEPAKSVGPIWDAPTLFTRSEDKIMVESMEEHENAPLDMAKMEQNFQEESSLSNGLDLGEFSGEQGEDGSTNMSIGNDNENNDLSLGIDVGQSSDAVLGEAASFGDLGSDMGSSVNISSNLGEDMMSDGFNISDNEIGAELSGEEETFNQQSSLSLSNDLEEDSPENMVPQSAEEQETFNQQSSLSLSSDFEEDSPENMVPQSAEEQETFNQQSSLSLSSDFEEDASENNTLNEDLDFNAGNEELENGSGSSEMNSLEESASFDTNPSVSSAFETEIPGNNSELEDTGVLASQEETLDSEQENEDEEIAIGDEIPIYGGINPEEFENEMKDSNLISTDGTPSQNVETEEQVKEEAPEIKLTDEEELLEKSIRDEFIESKCTSGSEENKSSKEGEFSDENVPDEALQNETVPQDEAIPQSEIVSQDEVVQNKAVYKEQPVQSSMHMDIPDTRETSESSAQGRDALSQKLMEKIIEKKVQEELAIKQNSVEKRSSKTINRNIHLMHYKKMLMQKTYPITLTFSKEKMTVQVADGIKQIAEKITISDDNPILKIIPQIPGCIVSAVETYADLSTPNTKTQIWVTPLTIGKVTNAKIQLWNKNKCLKQIDLSFKVVHQTAAKRFMTLALLFPILGLFYSLFATQIKEKSSEMVNYLLQHLETFAISTQGVTNLSLIIGLSFLAFAFLSYFITSHKKALPISESIEVNY